MKNKKLYKILLALTVISLLLSGCAGNGDSIEDSSTHSEVQSAIDDTEAKTEAKKESDTESETETESDAETETETESESESESDSEEDKGIAIFNDGKCLYRNVVYHTRATEAETEAATIVFNALKELGASVKLKTDGNYNATTKEIVIALASSYPEVSPIQMGLRYNDYAIGVVGNKLVVTAMSLEGLEAGATKLMRMITSAAGKEVTDLYVNEVRYEARYRISSFTVSGNDIRDYTIVYPKVTKSSDIDHSGSAEQWQSLIGTNYGYMLPIKDDSAAPSDKEILIGSTNRAESADYTEPLHYGVRVSGSKLVIDCGGVYSHEKLCAQFSGTFMSGKKTVALDESSALSGDLLTEPELARTSDTDIRIMASNILAEGVNWNSTGAILPVQPRLEILLANLYAYKPDVVAVTETSQLWAENLNAHLDNGYKLILTKFDDGKDNFSAIIYNANTLQLDGSGLVRYSETDGSAWCRNMAWGEFTVKSTGKEFAFISTHWDVHYPQHTAQADEFNAKIVELSKGGTRPVMTGGDMNVRVGGPNYERLMGYGNVNNAKHVTTNLRNDIATCKDIFVPAGDDPVKTIDHIFLTKDVECTMFMTVVENATIDLSDHNGIMADVKF